MAFKMTNPFKQEKQQSGDKPLSKEQQSKFSAWIEGSKKAVKTMKTIAEKKKDCADKGGVWKDGKCEKVYEGGELPG
jgi:hypothetical protein